MKRVGDIAQSNGRVFKYSKRVSSTSEQALLKHSVSMACADLSAWDCLTSGSSFSDEALQQKQSSTNERLTTQKRRQGRDKAVK